MAHWKGLPGETPIDVSHLKARAITNRDQLSLAEAHNVLKVTTLYFGRRRPSRRMAPFDLRWLKRLHQRMFCDVWKWAGQNRREQLNIGVHWSHIDVKLQELLDDLRTWEQCEMDLAERAARLHHRAVAIHPFPNGNGRWARMLANIYLRLNDQPIIRWPEDVLGETASSVRDSYIAALKAADGGDYDSLIALHRRWTEAARGRKYGHP